MWFSFDNLKNLKEHSIDFENHDSEYGTDSEQIVGTNSKFENQYLETILRNSHSEAATGKYSKESVFQKSIKYICQEVHFLK